ncbi:MAG: winged helix-turn-helix domain-containing protein [bacterium]
MNDNELLGHFLENALVAKKDSHLFLAVSDYVNYVDSSERWSAIMVEKVLSERRDLESRLSELGAEVIAESERCFDAVSAKLISHGIKVDGELTSRLDAYRNILSGSYQSSEPYPKSVYGSVGRLLSELKDRGHGDLFADSISTDDKTTNYVWTFSKKYREYEELLQVFERRRRDSAWGSWETLGHVFHTIALRDQITKKLSQHGYEWTFMNYLYMASAMDKILDSGSALGQTVFDRESTEWSLRRIHARLLLADGGGVTESQSSQVGTDNSESIGLMPSYQVGPLILDLEKGQLVVRGQKPLDVSTKSRPMIMLRLLMQKPGVVVSHSEIVDASSKEGSAANNDDIDANKLRVQIDYLLIRAGMDKQKAKELIRSERGKGYKIYPN